MTSLSNTLIAHWYQPRLWGWLLWPVSLLFRGIVRLRRYCYHKKIFKVYKSAVPVIVIGNITVGGTGKTPLVIYLVQLLQEMGFKPGVITRGYKGTLRIATLVDVDADPKLVGDEAILLAQRCNCPVVIAKKRAAGAKKLAEHYAVNIILSDDGLQHYALDRNLEIAIIDAERGFGNGHSLPMGPLREPIARLEYVDMIIMNGDDMQLKSENAYALANPMYNASLKNFKDQTVHAVAGIGNPERFFAQLRAEGIKVIPHAFADHHKFKASDLQFSDALPVFMTEKDAVKCRYFANKQHWVVTVNASLAEYVKDIFCKLVREL